MRYLFDTCETLHVEISFCQPKKKSKILKLNTRSAGFYEVHRIQFSPVFMATALCIATPEAHSCTGVLGKLLWTQMRF